MGYTVSRDKPKVVLLTDLDDTLIYGKKKYKGGDICVERRKNNEPVTYMNKGVLGKFLYLQEIYKGFLEIIPVTSRSIEQYLRIFNTGILQFKYAFTDNGGCLLVGDEVYKSDSWGVSDSLRYLEQYKSKLGEYVNKVSDADGYYYYGLLNKEFIGSSSMQCETDLGEAEDGSRVYLQKSGSKLYLLTDKINKGNALKAVTDYSLINGNTDITIICAGDSVMDIPMAKWADISIFSSELDDGSIHKGGIRGKLKFIGKENNRLSNVVLNETYKVCKDKAGRS